mgnify:CR=1 FL=1
MQDITRGQTRVRAWPEKRGAPKTAAEADRQAMFRIVQKAAAYLAPGALEYIHKATKNSPLLVRDVVTMQLYNRWMTFQLEDGREIWPMPAYYDVSEALDVLTNIVGDYLVRTEQGWKGASAHPSPPRFYTMGKASRSANLAIPGGTYLRIAFDVVDDPTGKWWTGAPDYAWKPDAPGFYFLDLGIQKNGNNMTNLYLIDPATGAAIYGGRTGPAVTRSPLTTIMYLDGNTAISSGTQSTAAGTVITAAPHGTQFNIFGPF